MYGSKVWVIVGEFDKTYLFEQKKRDYLVRVYNVYEV